MKRATALAPSCIDCDLDHCRPIATGRGVNPGAALVEYQAVLKKEPNRFRAVYGAAKAAELSRNAAAARKYYQQLIDLCPKADTPARAELVEARAYVAKK